MEYKVLFSEDALRDFEETLEFIRTDDDAAAWNSKASPYTDLGLLSDT